LENGWLLFQALWRGWSHTSSSGKYIWIKVLKSTIVTINDNNTRYTYIAQLPSDVSYNSHKTVSKPLMCRYIYNVTG